MAQAPQSPALQKIIFDTDVLVWYFRGNDAARSFIARALHPSRAVSSLTVMELLQGCRNPAEVRNVRAFLFRNVAWVIHPNESISDRAIGLLEAHAAPHGLRVVDAIIAATALQAGCALATANVKHYSALAGLELIRFRA